MTTPLRIPDRFIHAGTAVLTYTLVAIILTVSGCTSRQTRTGPFHSVVDALERSVEFRFPPERVVTIAPSVTEIVFASGAMSRIVGVSTADDYPPEVENIFKFSALPVNFEAIVGLRPDLILATTQVNGPTDAETFAHLGLKVFYLNTRSLDDIIVAVETSGELLGTSDIARSAARELRRRVDSLSTLTESIKSRPKVLFLISDKALYSFGSDSYVQDLIRLAGGESIAGSISSENPVLSNEFVLKSAPDVIIGTFGEDYDTDDLLSARPTWAIVPAVRHNRVFTVNGDLILRAGPRVVDGAYELYHILQSR
jgi:iron complex transport system substrate-binding protein